MRLFLLITALIAFTAQPSLANTATPGGLLGQSTGSGGCDLTEYKKKLGYSESGGDYKARNKRLGYAGKYQFGEGLSRDLGIYSDSSIACSQCWQDFSGQFNMSECGGVTTFDQWLNCPAAQEKAFEMQYAHNYKLTKKCHNYIGKPAPVGGCTVSLGGIMGGAHLGGAGGVCKYLTSNGDYNPGDGHTKISDYVCKFAEVQVPHDTGACSQPGTPGTYTASGEPPLAGGAGAYPTTLPGDSPRFFNDLSDTLKRVWVATFQLMTEQLVTNMMHQAKIIGTFFDAKHQLETQRLLQTKYAEAHKDYHPSQQMCTIGTAVRDLANTEKRAELTKTALTNAMLDRALATGDVKTSQIGSDQETRSEEYKKKFCNKEDNTQDNEKLCEGSPKAEQINADINFTQTIDAPLTIEIDLLDSDTQPEEENIFAMLDYIFMHNNFPWIPQSKSTLGKFVQPYQDMRSVIAMRSVAQNSFAEIIAQKTQGPENTEETASPFIKAIMQEMGVAPEEIEDELGERPSYYAQMEVLTKKIYQHPEFVSNLYDKPANVKRMIAAMTAIKVMQDRDIHEAMMRREMLMSMLLEIQLRDQQQDLENREIRKILSLPPPTGVSGGGGGGGGGGGF